MHTPNWLERNLLYKDPCTVSALYQEVAGYLRHFLLQLLYKIAVVYVSLA